MSEIHPSSLSESQAQSRESQIIVTPATQEYISHDARLQRLNQEPGKSMEIASTILSNSTILSQSDNIREQQRILGDTIPGYNQMTKDGREFSTLKEEDVDNLSRSEKKDYYKWKQSILDQSINKIEIKTEQRTIEEGQRLALTQKTAGENNEKINKLEELNTKLPAINKEVENITAKLSVNDKSTLSTALSQAKNGQDNNAAVLELKRQGVQDEDIKSGKYDSYISASIIIENAGRFEAAKDPEFQRSIRALQSQGIPVRVEPDFSSVRDHITERFSSGNRTDTAISGIRTDLASQEYNGVHYDGIGDRYTLVGADGKTRKDVYMDKPPRAEISMNGLSVGREMPPATPEDMKRQAIQDAYAKNYEKIGKLNINPVVTENDRDNERSKELYTKAIDGKLSPQERISAIEELKSLNGSRKEENFKKMLDGNTDPEPLNSKLEEEYRTLDSLEIIYREELSLREQAKKIPNPDPDTFDEDAKKSLKYLTSIGYDELGQEVLDKVITAINFHQKGYLAEIDLSKNPKLDPNQEKELLRALAQLSRKSNLMKDWQGVNPNDEIIAARQFVSPNWRPSLQDINKSLGFQAVKGRSQEAFAQYLYAQPQAESVSENTEK